MTDATGYKRVFLTNSGTEAIEGALKIARRWGKDYGKSIVVSFENAFHGRTMGALSSMDRKKYREGFEPFLPGFVAIPFNDADALRRNVDQATLAVMLEFVHELKLLQQGYDSSPMKSRPVWDAWGSSSRTSTTTSVPTSSRLPNRSGGGLPLETWTRTPVTANPCTEIEPNSESRNTKRDFSSTSLGAILGGERVAEVRGMGLLLGMQPKRAGDPCMADTVLRFLPPLIITKKHAKVGTK